MSAEDFRLDLDSDTASEITAAYYDRRASGGARELKAHLPELRQVIRHATRSRARLHKIRLLPPKMTDQDLLLALSDTAETEGDDFIAERLRQDAGVDDRHTPTSQPRN